MIIAVDAGHGGVDPGAVYNGNEEKGIALAYSRILVTLLRDENHTVIETRPDDGYVLPSHRASIANGVNADLFISLHCNSCPEAETATGVEVLYYPTSFMGRMFAKYILDRWQHPVKRGIKPRADLTVLKQTKMPAVLVEMGFINHSADLARLGNGEYCMVNCKAMVEAVEAYDGLI